MPFITYDVAVSIDGYISGLNGDVSGFAHEGPVVEAYAARLQTYGTAIMGRGTYDFGVACGLPLGASPYPHMRTFVFSESLRLPQGADVQVVQGNLAQTLRNVCGDDRVYLCGGGAFAGAMLRAGLINRLCLKRAPILLGGGVPLFIDAVGDLRLTHHENFADGYVYQEFDVRGVG